MTSSRGGEGWMAHQRNAINGQRLHPRAGLARGRPPELHAS